MLQEKILKLFAYRLFPLLYTLAELDKSKQTKLQEKLVDLQTSIYKLDHHLETNWNVDLEQINRCWDKIHSDLARFGISQDRLDVYTAHIKKYQKHELELRKGILPTRFKMEFFYFYKSCDVKLLRRLIYETTEHLNQLASLPDWRYFDLITEINDDVEDVFEDLETINANGFMISYFIHGEKHTRERYLRFMDHIEQQSILRFSGNPSELQSEIHRSTIKDIELTKALMKDQFEKLKNFKITDSLLFREFDFVKKRIG